MGANEKVAATFHPDDAPTGQPRVVFDLREALTDEVAERLDHLVGRYESRIATQRDLIDKQKDTILQQTRIIESLSREVDTLRLQHSEDKNTIEELRDHKRGGGRTW